MMQPRFEKRVGSSPFGLVEQPRFRAAFDFMRLRAENGELDEVLSDWWEEFSLADDNLRQDMVDEVKLEQQQRGRPQRAPRSARGPKPEATTDAGTAGDAPVQADLNPADAGQNNGTDAPKKRRRRRRTGGRSGGDAPAQDPQV
jgi:poly(A) polymerase